MTTHSFIARAVLTASISLAGLSIVGCASEDKTPAYPTPPADSSMGNMGTSLKVPAGATLIAASGYPIASFTPPGDGSVYVYDADTNSIPLVTTGVSGKPIDLSNNSSLNPGHHFRIYFVPASKATTTAAPLGG